MSQTKQTSIRDVGLTTLYEPTDSTTVADIILVHGLQGSPSETWSNSIIDAKTSTPPTPGIEGRDSKEKTRSPGKSLLRRGRSHTNASLSDIDALLENDKLQNEAKVHWPRDLLPEDCPNARVLVWGYDCKVTEGYTAANKSNLFSHAKDFLYALERERVLGRPIIFVAHSLGGLIVKELLRRSQESEEPALKDILDSTKSVIFLGTPHRGSADHVALRGLARKVAGRLLRVDSNATIIRALGLDSPELELSRESFLQQWRTYNFQVKTFQESYAPSGISLGNLNDKIVPDVSSSLDDPRERAETLRGDNRSMAKFSGRDDYSYIKVVGEIKRVLSILDAEPEPETRLSRVEEESLRSLSFANMFDRQQEIREAVGNTCEWLYTTAEYRSWYSRENAHSDNGLLWLKGKPGSGKSMLIRHIVARAELDERPTATVAAFYFNNAGNPFERTPLGFLRSILYQICHQDPVIRAEFLQLHYERQRAVTATGDWNWSQNELEIFLKRIFTRLRPQPTMLFVDAVNECQEENVRELVYFLAELGKAAFDSNLDLKVCLSSRHYPIVRLPNCPEITIEAGNISDIAVCVKDKSKFIPATERELLGNLEDDIVERSSGVFSWAAAVVDLILQDIDGGQPSALIGERLKRVPPRIEDLYTELCYSFKAEERPLAIRLFQLVTFAKPLTIQDLFLACIFSMPGQEDTLVQWGYRESQVPPNERLERLLTTASHGMLEHRMGEVQFIHESAKEFFLSGTGLSLVEPAIAENPLGFSHKALATTYMDILQFRWEWPCLERLREYSQWQTLASARMAEEQGISMAPLLNRVASPNLRLLGDNATTNGQTVTDPEDDSISQAPSQLERPASSASARLRTDETNQEDDDANKTGEDCGTLSMAGVWFRDRAAERSVDGSGRDRAAGNQQQQQQHPTRRNSLSWGWGWGWKKKSGAGMPQMPPKGPSRAQSARATMTNGHTNGHVNGHHINGNGKNKNMAGNQTVPVFVHYNRDQEASVDQQQQEEEQPQQQQQQPEEQQLEEQQLQQDEAPQQEQHQEEQPQQQQQRQQRYQPPSLQEDPQQEQEQEQEQELQQKQQREQQQAQQ